MMARPTPDILAGLGTNPGQDDAVTIAMGPQAQRVATVHIRLDGGTQPRAGIDQAVVDDYHDDMQAGAQFPPIELVYDGTDYWLWDGFHRFHAWRKDGDRAIPAIVRQGTRRDAVLLSVGANATHGFRRTTQDKHRSVETLLRDPEWAQWSDREIARRCAVDHKTVSARRSALSGEIPQIEERRVARNGTEYTMATPQRSAAPAVASQGGNYAGVWEIEKAIRAWLPAFEEPIAVLENLKQHKGGSAYFDDLIEAGELPTPHRKGDIFQAVNNVLDQMRQAERRTKPLPTPHPYDPMELVEELVALESVALDGVDEAWLFDYMEVIAKRNNRSFDRRTFDFALRDAIRRQIADNERRQRLETARAASMAADQERQRLETARAASMATKPTDIEEQVEPQPIVSPVQTVNWRHTRGTVTDDGRILVQMTNGTRNPPWLELDDAGQHWMLSLIQQAQMSC